MKGIYTALVTPFQETGEIDWQAFDGLLAQQKSHGIDGLVICGTTAESPTLTREEKLALFRRARENLPSDFTLIAGTGSNDTRETVAFTREVEKLGYAKFLIVTPYYNKPSQNGLLAHFRAVADAVQGEIILYNVPGRTGVSLQPKTIAELAAHPRITALKEATGNLAFLGDIREALKGAGQTIQLLSGDDATFLDFVRAGGVGTISVASHIFPQQMRALYKNAVANAPVADAIQARCLPLFRDLFAEPNPTPVKFCLAEGGLLKNSVRLPLVPVEGVTAKLLRDHLRDWVWSDGALV